MKIKIDGFDAVSRIFSDMEANLTDAVNKALYDGAAIMADEVKKGLEAMPTATTQQMDKNGNPKWQADGHQLTGPTPKQKEDLIDSMGLASFQKNGRGETSTSVGFDGYGRSTWHGGEPLPNQVLMREVESGTSWMRKNPVIRPAVSRTKERIKKVMEQKFVKIQKGESE